MSEVRFDPSALGLNVGQGAGSEGSKVQQSVIDTPDYSSEFTPGAIARKLADNWAGLSRGIRESATTEINTVNVPIPFTDNSLSVGTPVINNPVMYGVGLMGSPLTAAYAGNAAGFNLTDDAVAAATSLIPGAGSYEETSEGINDFMGQADPIEALVGVGVGSVLGGPGKLATKLASSALYPTGSGMLSTVGRTGLQGLLGGAEGYVASAAEGENGLLTGLSTILGAATGMIGHAVVGEAAPVLHKAVTPRLEASGKWGQAAAPKSTVMDAVLAHGPGTSPLHFSEFKALVDEGAINVSSFDPGLPVEVQSEYLSNLADLIARTDFPSSRNAGPNTINPNWDREMDSIVAQANEYWQNVVKSDAARISDIAGIPEITASRRRALDLRLAKPRETYDALFNTREPGKGGNRVFNGTQIQNDFLKRMAAAKNTTVDRLPSVVGPQEQQIMTLVQHTMRARGYDDVAKIIQMIPTDRLPDGRLQEVSLVQLLDASKELRKYDKVGLSVNGTNVGKEQAAFASTVKNIIDDMIDVRTGGAPGKPGPYKQAKADYATIMQVDSMQTAGQDAFAQRLYEAPGTNMSILQWLNNDNVSKESKDAFKFGFYDALTTQIKTEGFHNTLKGYLGDTTLKNPAELKKYNLDVLEAVIGKEGIDALIKEGPALAERSLAAGALVDMLELKRVKPEAMGSLTREGDQYILSDPFIGRYENSLRSIAFRSAAMREFEQPGPRSAQAIVRYLAAEGGQEFSATLDEYLNAFATPNRLTTPGAVSGMLGAEAPNVVAREVEQSAEESRANIRELSEENSRIMEEYFRELGISR